MPKSCKSVKRRARKKLSFFDPSLEAPVVYLPSSTRRPGSTAARHSSLTVFVAALQVTDALQSTSSTAVHRSLLRNSRVLIPTSSSLWATLRSMSSPAIAGYSVGVESRLRDSVVLKFLPPYTPPSLCEAKDTSSSPSSTCNEPGRSQNSRASYVLKRDIRSEE